MPIIHLLVVSDFPNGNKNSARIKAYYDSLSRLEWECKFVILNQSRYYEDKESAKIKDVILLSRPFKNKQTRLTRYFTIVAGIFNSLIYISKLDKKDYVYFYNPTFFCSIYALMFSKIRGLKIVVDQTEIYSLERNRVLNKMAEYLSARMATIILAISSNIEQHFKSLGARRIVRFPIMVEMARFNIKVKPKKQLMGYIGSFAPKDGVAFMLKGLKEAQLSMPNLKLRLIGYNVEFPELESVIIKLGLEDSVELTGKVDFKDIPKLLKECDTLIMNRTSSKFASFGYPIKLGEYFACNRPIIMSDGSGFAEEYTHLAEAIKYIVDDLQSFKGAIFWRYENDEEAIGIANTGYNFAREHFDSFNQVKKLSHILENS